MTCSGFVVSGSLLKGAYPVRRHVTVSKAPLLLSVAPWRSYSTSTRRQSVSCGVQTAPIPLQIVGTSFGPPPQVGFSPSRIMVLFQTDLRVEDNYALNSAAKKASANPVAGAVLPTLLIGKRVPSAAAELKSELQSHGSDLATANYTEELLELLREHKMDALYFNHVVGDIAELKKQRKVVEAVQAAGTPVEGFWSNTLISPGHLKQAKSLSAVTKHIKGMTVTEPEKAPEKLPALPAGINCNDPRVVSKLGAGASAAELLLSQMSKPSETTRLHRGQDIVYRLKPLLDMGVVSPRRIHQRIVEVMGQGRGYTFSELVWKTYTCSVLHTEVTGVPVAA